MGSIVAHPDQMCVELGEGIGQGKVKRYGTALTMHSLLRQRWDGEILTARHLPEPHYSNALRTHQWDISALEAMVAKSRFDNIVGRWSGRFMFNFLLKVCLGHVRSVRLVDSNSSVSGKAITDEPAAVLGEQAEPLSKLETQPQPTRYTEERQTGSKPGAYHGPEIGGNQ